jgi:tRNA(Ile2) C34 agmatinyltransferase TiaS
MKCPECEEEMDSMGHGDELCPDCGHTEYSESEEDFYNRIYGKNKEPIADL